MATYSVGNMIYNATDNHLSTLRIGDKEARSHGFGEISVASSKAPNGDLISLDIYNSLTGGPLYQLIASNDPDLVRFADELQRKHELYLARRQ